MLKEHTELTPAVLNTIAHILTQRTGIVFASNRLGELRQGLVDVYEDVGGRFSFEEFLRRIEQDALGPQDLRRLISRVTVGETYFFRIRAQFDLLREKILPELMRSRERSSRKLRFWSAGCSTGEEAYSLAMLLMEGIPDIRSWDVHILATDISDEALAQAEVGEYREWSFREVEPAVKARYFTKLGSTYKIHPFVREMVSFKHLNLVEDTYPLSSTGTNCMDVIFCRNVMIYFKAAISAAITRRFYRALNNGGYLVIGHSEPSEVVFKGFKKVLSPHAVVYHKEEKSEDWNRGIRLRFRGSGPIPGNVVPCGTIARVKQVLQAPQTKGRHEVTQETALFEDAAIAYQQGQIEKAAGLFRKVLERNPRNHRACYMVALLEANANRLESAREFGLRTVELYPLALEAHYLLSVIAREEGELDRELEYLKKVIYINRKFILGHYQLGVHYLNRGNNVLARKFFRNTVKLLDKWDKNDYIEGAEGMTVGRLRDNVQLCLKDLELGQGSLL